MTELNERLRTPTRLARRIFREHLTKYKRKFVKAAFFMFLTALATAAIPYLLQPVFDDVFTTDNPNLLFAFCGAVLSAFIIKGIASYGETVTMTRIGQGIVSDIQTRVFRHLMSLDLEFFHKNNSGELLSRFTNDIALMRGSVANTVAGIGRDSFTLVFLIGLMFYRDAYLALASFIVFPAAILPIARIGRKMREVTFSAQEETAKFTKELTQIFQGIRVIKSYCAENYETERATKQIKRIYGLVVKTAKARSLAHPIIESMGGLAIIGVIAYGGWQVIHHSRTTGEFISFILALVLAYEPLKRLSNFNSNLQEGLAAAARVFEIVDSEATVMAPQNPVKTPSDTPLALKGKVTFNDARFSYVKSKEALSGISFSLNPGDRVAFVGASGAGKSTIINLIPRFYDLDIGSISIDDIDIRSLSLKDLRKNIALVSQEIALFDLSVAENIAYGHHGDYSKEDVYRVAKASAAHEFIEKLPNKYDTIIGENGVTLSGGQRQRLAIARAMLKNAPILLLDEATSALDTDSERHIQQSLKTLMSGRTTIMVAHRLSTVVDAKRIYVLDAGKIAEQGTHSELLSLNKRYAHLWREQARHSDRAPV